MKKRRGKLVAGLAVSALFLMGAALWFMRPDLQFRVRDAWHGVTDSMDRQVLDLKPEDLEQKEVTELNRRNCLVLINEEYPAGETYETQLVKYKETEVLMAPEAVDAFSALSVAVKEETGDTLYIRDSYRSYDEQVQVYAEEPEVAALPGSSEHMTGLAFDVYVSGFAGYGFIKSEAGQFVNENCWKYGFIIRYPQFGKSATRIPYEPWHIRYLGLPHSEYIYRNHLTLEEYLEGLETGKFYQTGDYLVSLQEGDMLQIPRQAAEVTVSPDHRGGWIVTCQWKE